MVIVLEDDVRFKPYFIRELHYLLKEAQTIEWDLIYLGRKRGPGAQNDKEQKVTERITTATYSYWTIGYILKEYRGWYFTVAIFTNVLVDLFSNF